MTSPWAKCSKEASCFHSPSVWQNTLEMGIFMYVVKLYKVVHSSPPGMESTRVGGAQQESYQEPVEKVSKT